MTMFGAPTKSKNGPGATQLAEPPLPPSVRAYAPPRQVRTYAEAAAEAAQHEIDQQNKIHALQDELQALRTRLDLVEKANEMLHEEAANREQQHNFIEAKLTRERDDNLSMFLAMKTRLEVSAGIILEAIDAAQAVNQPKSAKLPVVGEQIAPDHEAPPSFAQPRDA